MLAFNTTPSGLQIEEILVGEGEIAQNGSQVLAHYTLWLDVNGEAGRKLIPRMIAASPFPSHWAQDM